MTTLAIVQARMTSTRLPGKVLLPLAGEPALAHLLRRLWAAPVVDRIAVAVPAGEAHEPIAEVVARFPGVHLVAGSEHDVLDRFITALDACGGETVVRITADCPLLQPRIVDAVVALKVALGVPYAATAMERGVPPGCDVEAVDAAALRAAHREARDPYEREHVTPFLWRQPARFPAAFLDAAPDRRAWRLTLDTADDYALLAEVFAELAPADPLFTLDDVAALFARRPDLPAMNVAVHQTPYDWGTARDRVA